MGLYKIPRFETPRFKTRVFETKVTVASGPSRIRRSLAGTLFPTRLLKISRTGHIGLAQYALVLQVVAEKWSKMSVLKTAVLLHMSASAV